MGFTAQQRRDQHRLKNLSEQIRRGEFQVVVGDINAEALISSGILLRTLNALGVSFEFFTVVDPVDFSKLDGRVIGVEAYIQNCANCVELADLKPRKTSQHIFHIVLELVKELATLFREEYTLLISSALARYTPRSLTESLSREVLEFINDMVSSGAIREVVTPKLIGWGSLPLEEVVRYSVDTCVLKYFGKPVSKIVESEIARELKVESLKHIEDKTYVPNYDAGILDLYEAAYIVEHTVDVEGPEYTAFTPLNYSYFLWAVKAFRESIEQLSRCLDAVLGRRLEREGAFYILDCDLKTSATVATKILRGSRLIEESASVAYRVADKYFVPLQLLTRTQRAKLSGSRVVGGYVEVGIDTLSKIQKT
ncbi:MAG: hypothetical protein RMI56_00465 [Sulfolobales archaeon]|nr:hypothetical protein [Sulfolobales archaeon]MDW8082252.1 hypothetical protein [Sulfolobales archaeon]